MRKKKKNDLRLEALHTAVRRNDVKTVMSMLKKIKSEDFIDSHPNHHEYAGNGSKKEEVDCRGYCSDGGNTRTITKKNFLMEKQFKNGYSALHVAAHHDRRGIAQVLLQQGAYVDAAAFNSVTPLHVACKLGHVDMVLLLLKHRANINALTKDKLTALHCASRNGKTDVMRVLVENGANLSYLTKNKLTCLHLCCQGNHVAGVEYLLQKCQEKNNGALLEAVSSDLLTALHVSAHCGSLQAAQALLQASCNVNPKARNGFTPLHIAVKKNHAMIAELLIRFNCDLEATTESGSKALSMACYLGHMDIVSMVLVSGACIEGKDNKGNSPIHFAIKGNQPEVLASLLSLGADVNATNKEGQTALHLSCRQGSDHFTDILLKQAVNLDAITTSDHLSPLHIASSLGETSIAQKLLNAGANPYLLTKKGLNCFHLATKHNKLKIIDLFLNNGFDVNSAGKNNLCATHLAVHYNTFEAFRLLRDKGANLQLRTQNGFTLLHIGACRNRELMVKRLIETALFDINDQSENGCSPLHLCSKHGHSSIASVLIDNGSNVNLKTYNGLTPLHLAAQEGHVKVADILYKNRAHLNAQTNAGYTPLHTACHFGQVSMVRWLLRHSAKVNSQNKHGYTPLHQASQQGHLLVVDSLLKHHADPNIVSLEGETALFISQLFGHKEVEELLKGVTRCQTREERNGERDIHSPEVVKEADMFDPEDVYSKICSEEESYSCSLRSLKGSLTKQLSFDFEHDVQIYHSSQKTKKKGLKQNCSKILNGKKEQFQKETTFEQERSVTQLLDIQNNVKQTTIEKDNSKILKKKSSDTLQNDTKSHSNQENHHAPESSLALEKLKQQQSFLQQLSMDPPINSTPLTLFDNFEGVTNGNDTQEYQNTSSIKVNGNQSSKDPPNKLSCPDHLYNPSKPPLQTKNSRTRTYSARSHNREIFTSSQKSLNSKCKGNSELNLHLFKNIHCTLLHPDTFKSSTTSTPLPPLSHAQGLATWIIQCHPAGKVFKNPISIEVPFMASLKKGESELLVLRCSDGINWRQHISPPTNRTSLHAIKPTFQGIKPDKIICGDNRFSVTTASLPCYFALICRPVQLYSDLCSAGLALRLPLYPISLKVGPHSSTQRLPFLSLSAQSISENVIEDCSLPKFCCSPLMTITPYNHHYSCPLLLSVSKQVLDKSANEASSNIQDFVYLYRLSPEFGWANLTGKTKLYKDENDTHIVFLVKSGGSYLLSNCSLKEGTLSYLHNRLDCVDYMADFVFYAKVDDQNNVRIRSNTLQLKALCGTCEVVDMGEELVDWIEVCRVSNVQLTNGTLQMLEISGPTFETHKNNMFQHLLFKAFNCTSSVFILFVKTSKSFFPLTNLKKILTKHIVTIFNVAHNRNGETCLRRVASEPMKSAHQTLPSTLVPVKIDINEKFDKNDEIRNEGDVVRAISTDQGTLCTEVNVEESVEKMPNNSASKNKTISKKYKLPIVHKNFVNNSLENIKKSERIAKLAKETFSLIVPNSYIEPDVSLIDFQFLYNFETKKQDENNYQVSESSLKICLRQLQALSDTANKTGLLGSLIEGPILGVVETNRKNNEFFEGKVIMKEDIITYYKKPLYKMIKCSPGVEKRILLRENIVGISVLENISELPMNISNTQNLCFETSLKQYTEVLEDGTLKYVKVLNTKTSSNSLSSTNSKKKVLTCKKEIQFDLMGQVSYQENDESIENNKKIIVKHLIPILELTYRTNELPEVKINYNEIKREFYNVSVSVDCGFIEPFADNCILNIDTNGIDSEDSTLKNKNDENIYDNVHLLKDSEKNKKDKIKKVTFSVKIRPPRYVQKLVEGNIQIKNSEEDFKIVSENGKSVKNIKVITSQYFKPVTMLLECDGVVVNSSKIEKLLKTIIKENILEMPVADINSNSCVIDIEVNKEKEKQFDYGLVEKISTKMTLKNAKELAKNELNAKKDVDKFHIKDDVLVEHVTSTSRSFEDNLRHHKTKTTTYIKKFFKKNDASLMNGNSENKNLNLFAPDLIQIIKQNVVEEIFEKSSEIKDLQANNVDFSINDTWLEELTPCGAPRKKHVVLVKAFVNPNVKKKKLKNKLVEEIEGKTQLETEETEEEKTINNVRYKQKIITTKHVKPITILRYNESEDVPEINVREELVKVEINEYLFELDKELCSPNDCVSTVENYNYIKYMPNGVPLNTEVTKITARLKKHSKITPDSESNDSLETSHKIKQKKLRYSMKEERLSKISEETQTEDTMPSNDITDHSITQPPLTLEAITAELNQKNIKQKVCTTENFQQLKNGDFIKSKIENNFHVQIKKSSDLVSNISDVFEKTIRKDITEVYVNLPNGSIEAFALNCIPVLNVKKESSFGENCEELNHLSIHCIIELKNKLTEERFKKLKENNLFLLVNPCCDLGESWCKTGVELDVIKVDDTTKQFVRRVRTIKYRPLYLINHEKNSSNNELPFEIKSFSDVCIEEIDELEVVYEAKSEDERCLSLENLKIMSNDYQEKFDNGCAFCKRRIFICTKTFEDKKIDEELEEHILVKDRGDEFREDGSLRRWVQVDFQKVKPIFNIQLTDNLFFVGVQVEYEVVESKLLVFDLLLPVCSLFAENKFEVDINIAKDVGNFHKNDYYIKVEIKKKVKNSCFLRKTFTRKELRKKVFENEKEARLSDNRVVKWKTLTREFFLPVVESVLEKNDVREFLMKIEIYVVLIELGSEEIIVDEGSENNDSIFIIKECDNVYAVDGTPIEKVMIKCLINPINAIGIDDKNQNCQKNFKKSKSVENDVETLENGTKVYRQTVKCLSLKPYYEISETKNPMLKEYIVSEENEETVLWLEEEVDLNRDNLNDYNITFERIKIQNSENKATYVNKIFIKNKDPNLAFEDYDNLNEENNNSICGSVEFEDKCLENNYYDVASFTKEKEWKKEYFIPLVDLKLPQTHAFPSISFNRNVLCRQKIKALITIPRGSCNINVCESTIETNLQEEDLIRAIGPYVANKNLKKLFEKSFTAKISLKKHAQKKNFKDIKQHFVEENKQDDSRKVDQITDTLDSDDPIDTILVEMGDVLTKKTINEIERIIYEGEIRSRVDVEEDEEEDDYGSVVKKKIITTTYYRFVTEKILKNNEEIIRSERVEDLCQEVEEIYLSLAADMEDPNGELEAETTVHQCDEEFSKTNLPLKRKTIRMKLKNYGSLDKLSTCSSDQPLIKKIEGDILSTTSIMEYNSVSEDGSKSFCKRNTTRFFRPVAKITLSAGNILDAIINEETSHFNIIENLTVLFPGVKDPDDLSVCAVCSEEIVDEKTDEGIPVIKTIKIKNIFRKGLHEAEEVEEDNPIEVIEELIGGVIYKNLVIDVKDNPTLAKTKSIFPKLFLKQSELRDCMKVYNNVKEESPLVTSKTQESVDVLPDGTKVRKRFTEINKQKAVLKKMAHEENGLNSEDFFNKAKGKCVKMEADKVEKKKKIMETKNSTDICGKLFERNKNYKYVSETKFMLAQTDDNDLDDFFETF